MNEEAKRRWIRQGGVLSPSAWDVLGQEQVFLYLPETEAEAAENCTSGIAQAALLRASFSLDPYHPYSLLIGVTIPSESEAERRSKYTCLEAGLFHEARVRLETLLSEEQYRPAISAGAEFLYEIDGEDDLRFLLEKEGFSLRLQSETRLYSFPSESRSAASAKPSVKSGEKSGGAAEAGDIEFPHGRWIRLDEAGEEERRALGAALLNHYQELYEERLPLSAALARKTWMEALLREGDEPRSFLAVDETGKVRYVLLHEREGDDSPSGSAEAFSRFGAGAPETEAHLRRVTEIRFLCLRGRSPERGSRRIGAATEPRAAVAFFREYLAGGQGASSLWSIRYLIEDEEARFFVEEVLEKEMIRLRRETSLCFGRTKRAEA